MVCVSVFWERPLVRPQTGYSKCCVVDNVISHWTTFLWCVYETYRKVQQQAVLVKTIFSPRWSMLTPTVFLLADICASNHNSSTSLASLIRLNVKHDWHQHSFMWLHQVHINDKVIYSQAKLMSNTLRQQSLSKLFLYKFSFILVINILSVHSFNILFIYISIYKLPTCKHQLYACKHVCKIVKVEVVGVRETLLN